MAVTNEAVGLNLDLNLSLLIPPQIGRSSHSHRVAGCEGLIAEKWLTNFCPQSAISSLIIQLYKQQYKATHPAPWQQDGQDHNISLDTKEEATGGEDRGFPSIKRNLEACDSEFSQGGLIAELCCASRLFERQTRLQGR